MPRPGREQQLAERQTRLAVLEQERRRVRLRPALVALAVGLVGATAFSAAVWPANFLPDTPAHAADLDDYLNDPKARASRPKKKPTVGSPKRPARPAPAKAKAKRAKAPR